MTSRNEHTGDLMKSKANSDEYRDNHEKIFGKSRVQRGKYKWCEETRKFIPAAEYYAKYGAPKPRPKTPMIVCNHFEAFESPVTGEVISSKRDHQYDLESNGCRVFEGQEAEQREVDRQTAYFEEATMAEMGETIEQTAHDIEHGYHKVGDNDSGAESFTFGE